MSTSSTSWTTTALTLSIPLAGRYDVIYEARVANGGSGVWTGMSLSGAGLSAGGAVDLGAHASGGTATAFPTSSTRRVDLTAGTLTENFRTASGGIAYVEQRTIKAIPIRVG